MAVTEANRQAQATWSNQACGMRDDGVPGYAVMNIRRYTEDDPWIPGVLQFPLMNGKKVLEIGYGMGCDITTAALRGAIVHGIDLTPNHYEIAQRTLADAGKTADLRLGNAGALPFESESMDIVYSLGVLHHTDNTEQCIAEARRVLKPGGRLIISLYHFWSLPHLSLLAHGVLNGKLFKLGYRNLLSTVEAGADGVTIRPLVKLYSKRAVRELLSDFSSVETSIRGAAYNKRSPLGSRIPHWIGNIMDRTIGWYVVANAVK